MSRVLAVGRWEGAAVERLAARWHIPELIVLEETGSTNDVLRDRAAAGAPAGTTVIAERQTAGRGRLGREWQAPAGRALLCSVLLRPAAGPVEAAAALPLRIGLAVADAIETTTGVAASLKWPNDVLAGDGKVAGILCESAAGFVVAGIGINVGQAAAELPAADPPATSLGLVTGHPVDRAALAGALLARLQPLFHAPHRHLDPGERARYVARDALHGRPVTVDGDAAGVARGIDAAGALLVERDGALRPIHAGTVRIRT